MEMRVNGLTLTGRIVEGPITKPSGRIYFRLEADEEEKPFPCFCEGLTAKNLQENCSVGDEITLEGQLRWLPFFKGDALRRELYIQARFISYGRKARTLR